MKYDSVLMGERIKNARIDAGYKTQASLLRKLEDEGFAISRNTYSGIEGGKIINFDWRLLSKLSDLLNCEVGYLLGEYNCKTGRNTDISKETGLNDEAINKLLQLSSSYDSMGLTDVLELLITHPKFEYFLALISFVPKDITRTQVINNALVEASEEAIVNVEISNTVRDISVDIRNNHTKLGNSPSIKLFDIFPEK